jgi:hypothetical protein
LGYSFDTRNVLTRFNGACPNSRAAIRERTYHLWMADGQPEGQADIYWLNAQREILTTSAESPGSNANAPAPTNMESVATKPAKNKGRPIGKKQDPRRIVHASIVTLDP